jgi:hypothetical protein
MIIIYYPVIRGTSISAMWRKTEKQLRLLLLNISRDWQN